MDYSSPGSSVHGILQARILEWVAMRRDPSPSPGDLPNMEYLDPSVSEGFPGDSVVKNPPSEARDTWVQSLHQEDPLKEIAAHCSLLVWRIPGTEEPGGLQSMGSQRVRQRLSNFTTTTTTSFSEASNPRAGILLPVPGTRVGGGRRSTVIGGDADHVREVRRGLLPFWP